MPITLQDRESEQLSLIIFGHRYILRAKHWGQDFSTVAEVIAPMLRPYPRGAKL